MSDNQSEVYNFTAELQKQIVAMMLFDKVVLMSNVMIIKPEFFDSPVLKDLTKLILGFFKEYKRPPTETEFLNEVDGLFSKNKKLPIEEYCTVVTEIINIGKEAEFDYVRDKVIAFARRQGAKRVLLKVDEKRLDQKGYVEDIVGDLRKTESMGESEEDLGEFLIRDLSKHLELRRTVEDRSLRGIATGFRQIDYHLGGGICPKEMLVIMGPTGRGKTVVAANFVKNILTQGHHVVHFLFESNAPATKEIYHAMITGVEKFGLMKREPEVKQLWEDFFKRTNIGELVIKHMDAGDASAWTLENHLYKLEAEGLKPSVIIVDYLTLMRPMDKSVKYEGSSTGRYLQLGRIVIELINLAQRKNIAIWLLHQSKGYVKEKYKKGGRQTTEDAADSQDISRHIDGMLTLEQSIPELETKPNQIMRIHGAKGRSFPDNWEVEFEFKKETAQIWESKTEAK